jgi:leucyl/phenylalanyl-tRNA--protein transferase
LNSTPIKWIHPGDPPDTFPALATATVEPDGLLAAGGDLSSERLLYAYRNGIFPWYDDSQPVLWWSPDPRCVLRPADFRISRRLQRFLRNSEFEVDFNSAFSSVISACAEDREGQSGTWITGDMMRAYARLHDEGWAHSIEIWEAGSLVGGLYGLAIGRVFFGESMFSRANNASKAAMLALCCLADEHDFPLIDCQVASPHLESLGAEYMERDAYARELASACQPAEPARFWPDRRISATEFLKRRLDALQ